MNLTIRFPEKLNFPWKKLETCQKNQLSWDQGKLMFAMIWVKHVHILPGHKGSLQTLDMSPKKCSAHYGNLGNKLQHMEIIGNVLHYWHGKN